MKLIHTDNVYSFILLEDEWYLATEQQKEAWINQIKREAAKVNARFVSIMVKPDAVMSISPVDKQHRVWYYTVPTTAEEDVYRELLDVCARYVGKGEHKLSISQARAIAKRVFG